jgi:uncharacterized protein YbjT (DUF2867 family)
MYVKMLLRQTCQIFILLIIFQFSWGALSGRKVVVTGAAGRTGQLVWKSLLSQGGTTVGLVRTPKSIKKLKKRFGMDVNDDNVKVCDVTSTEALETAFAGADAVVLCTSAVPKIKIFSILKVLLMKLFRRSGRPEFRFLPNGDPYNVDWLGAKNQIDSAKAAGVDHFIFVSSMGGTQPENFLNTIGRVDGDEKSGNILLWKRKAEEYLIASGMSYTIIHPGGLLDKEGGREVIFGVDDTLLERKVRSIPRADVAACCVAALTEPRAKNRSIDICSEEPDVDEPFTGMDWGSFFKENSANCKY